MCEPRIYGAIMTAAFWPLSPADIASTTAAWQYSRPLGSGAVEVETVRGFDVGLPIHFHDEDQITFVLSGSRRFIIGDELVKIGPDEGERIPAGLPHRSLVEDSEMFCINIYTSPGDCCTVDLISSLARLRRGQGYLSWADLTELVKQHMSGTPQSTNPMYAASSGQRPWRSVTEAAQLSGVTREGFSRRFRRRRGMPPQSFQLIEKLNDARRLLRQGDSIAEVAAQTGFADQSHLGRLFRRVFGVTPGRYRTG
jgi:AraC-like DNA-binding protein/quercetin dioxygenase-like cupin family protein